MVRQGMGASGELTMGWIEEAKEELKRAEKMMPQDFGGHRLPSGNFLRSISLIRSFNTQQYSFLGTLSSIRLML